MQSLRATQELCSTRPTVPSYLPNRKRLLKTDRKGDLALEETEGLSFTLKLGRKFLLNGHIQQQLAEHELDREL